MASFITTALFLITMLYNGFCSATQLNFCSAKQLEILRDQENIAFEAKDNMFANNLFLNIAAGNWKKNVLVSPASIYASLSFLYLGAEGITADQTRTALNLPQESKQSFASKYGNFLKNTLRKASNDSDALQLQIANRLYVNNNIKISQSFNEIAQNLDFEAKNIDFSQASVADEINKWVEQQTNNKITNIMQPNAIDSQTSAVLVNSIYLNAKWLYPFLQMATRNEKFYINENEIVQVKFMVDKANFKYGELNDLDATALELPYKDSDISMLILLPNEGSNLEKLEKNLRGKDLNNITSQMVQQEVRVHFPKFRIEYDIDLKEPLIQLGITSMFEENANLNGIFDSDISQRISNVKHKTYLECREGGTEAAGSTFIPITPFSLVKETSFHANRPFAFFVRNSNTVFFAGHVATLS